MPARSNQPARDLMNRAIAADGEETSTFESTACCTTESRSSRASAVAVSTDRAKTRSCPDHRVQVDFRTPPPLWGSDEQNSHGRGVYRLENQMDG